MASEACGPGEPRRKRRRAKDGPRDILEFMAWPRAVADTLQELGMAREAAVAFGSLDFVSDYSGFGMMEMATAALHGELQQRGMQAASAAFHSACDISASCRKVLTSFPDNHGPACAAISAHACACCHHPGGPFRGHPCVCTCSCDCACSCVCACACACSCVVYVLSSVSGLVSFQA